MQFNDDLFKKIDAPMLERISNNPVEASGCIQYLIEQIARRQTIIDDLDIAIENHDKVIQSDQNFINRLLERFVMPGYWKKLWYAVISKKI